MPKGKKGLGKGLGAIFGDDVSSPVNASPKKSMEKVENKSGEIKIKTSLIEPNGNQPRKKFDEDDLNELTESVRQYGVLQPLLVQKNGPTFKIIAGERRWRAAKAAGLKEIPVVVRDYSPQQATEISIIENVQRADLNPIEEAKAYRMLMDDYGLKQEEIAQKVSKNRTTVTNTMRLLKLCDDVQNKMIDGSISPGHARALLGIEDAEAQKAVAEEVISRELSVRDTEKLVKAYGRSKQKKKKEEGNDYSLFFRDYEDRMKEILGTKVHINRKDKNKGRIEIEYYSASELERIMDLFKTVHQ